MLSAAMGGLDLEPRYFIPIAFLVAVVACGLVYRFVLWMMKGRRSKPDLIGKSRTVGVSKASEGPKKPAEVESLRSVAKSYFPMKFGFGKSGKRGYREGFFYRHPEAKILESLQPYVLWEKVLDGGVGDKITLNRRLFAALADILERDEKVTNPRGRRPSCMNIILHVRNAATNERQSINVTAYSHPSNFRHPDGDHENSGFVSTVEVSYSLYKKISKDIFSDLVEFYINEWTPRQVIHLLFEPLAWHQIKV